MCSELMKLAVIAATAMFCVTFVSCKKSTAPQSSGQTMYDRTWDVSFSVLDESVAREKTVATGKFRLPGSWIDMDTFSGAWDLRATGNANATRPADADDLGPITGQGTFTAVHRDTQLVIELYPGMIDNNVEIQLTIVDSTVVSGRWSYVTDAGITASGTVQVR